MIIKRKGPRFGEQKWEDILFLHWPVDKKLLQAQLPPAFQINEWGGSAWLSAVIFTAKETKLIKTPRILSYPNFSQFNLRTYVNFDQEKGVYFLSNKSNDPLMTNLGRLAGLPFTHGQINYQPFEKGAQIQIFDRHQKKGLSLSYRQSSQSFQAKEDSLAHFLTEKYCIWMIKGKSILKLPVSHSSWTLKEADLHIKNKSLVAEYISEDTSPIAHYSKLMHAYIHPYERIGRISKS